MAIHRIVLFYAFQPVPDPEAIRLWQRALCEKHELTGRILISPEGINVTVGGELNALKQYVKTTREYFRRVDVKWSDGSAEDFPRLSVKVREEIVSFGAPGELTVNNRGVVGGGQHLKPEELHELVERKDVVFFDGRNAFEAQIGKFKNAVVPEVETTRDFVAELESGKYDDLKDKPIVTYCTGGVRCEVLSTLMRNRGFQEVYQLDGGIVRYAEKYRDEGLWEGSLYVFDRRMHMEFGENTQTLGRCVNCQGPTSEFRNCIRPECRELTLYCDACATELAELPCAQHVAALVD